MASPTLPTFLIIGAAKSGTTSLYVHLREHPQVYMSPTKEPAFWAFGESDHRYTGPEDERRTMFQSATDYRQLFAARTHERASGEASVAYLYSARAADRIRQALPGAKLIVILRQPAERAFSHYLMHVRSGTEPLGDFRTALAAEPQRKAAGWNPTWFYRERGLYHQQLSRYFARFPADQIAVYLYDDLVADPAGLMQRIFRFLDVDPSVIPTIERHNAGGTLPRSRRLLALLRTPAARAILRWALPHQLQGRLRHTARARMFVPAELPSELRAELTAGYRPDIEQLQTLIDRDLAHWLR